MANRGEPDTNGCMFFITLNKVGLNLQQKNLAFQLDELSGRFVVFGECQTGDKILDQMDMSRMPGTLYPADIKIVDCGEIKPLNIDELLKKRGPT